MSVMNKYITVNQIPGTVNAHTRCDLFSGQKGNSNAMTKTNMKFGKRQIILAALILALGAAVYLNWQFSSTPVEQTSGNTTSSAGTSDNKLGVAELVNNQYVETVNDEVPDTTATETAAAISQARVDRQSARDEALDMLEDVLKDVDADSTAKQEAITEASTIAQNMVQETSIENLIKAKGIDDVVVFINGDSCSVIVSNLGDNALIIQDIITSQSNITADKINLIEAK